MTLKNTIARIRESRFYRLFVLILHISIAAWYLMMVKQAWDAKHAGLEYYQTHVNNLYPLLVVAIGVIAYHTAVFFTQGYAQAVARPGP